MVCTDATIAMRAEGSLFINEADGPEPATIDLAENGDVDLPDWIQRRDLDGRPVPEMRMASDHSD
ncbi:hypothetical protein C0Z11_12330 [Acidipropionibacterium jensenii]|uniref:hypothetical protein n=1 Tax=Acidipropionibacterium jensenii TaxID=1749 RepID=UPI000BEF170F|nr:hypothetical protein [Acidipropionibacterium jensenii]AZZ42956.1 hypothetical protein C0Z11_12330 [Acidipropionibacterium jensenii]